MENLPLEIHYFYTSDHQYVHFMTICPFTLTILDPYRESNLNPDVLSLFARTRA